MTVPHLTYRPREGVVLAALGGKTARLDAMRKSSGVDMWARREAAAGHGRVVIWEKAQEVRSGATSGTPGYSLRVAGSAALEVFDFPGRFAQRFDGVDAAEHRHHGRMIWVKFAPKAEFPEHGVCLHGSPPCANPNCIVVLREWDALFQAIRIAGRVSIAVEL